MLVIPAKAGLRKLDGMPERTWYGPEDTRQSRVQSNAFPREYPRAKPLDFRQEHAGMTTAY